MLIHFMCQSACRLSAPGALPREEGEPTAKLLPMLHVTHLPPAPGTGGGSSAGLCHTHSPGLSYLCGQRQANEPFPQSHLTCTVSCRKFSWLPEYGWPFPWLPVLTCISPIGTFFFSDRKFLRGGRVNKVYSVTIWKQKSTHNLFFF